MSTYPHVFLLSLADDLTISPDDGLVARRGTRATLLCVYKPNNVQQIGWGVLRNGQPNVLFSVNSTDTNIYFSPDTHSLIFEPVMPSHAGNYYCTVSLTGNVAQDQYSSTVELIVFGKHDMILVVNVTLYLCLQRSRIL